MAGGREIIFSNIPVHVSPAAAGTLSFLAWALFFLVGKDLKQTV